MLHLEALFITSLCTKLCNKQPRARFSRTNINIFHEPPQKPHSYTPPPPFNTLLCTFTIQDTQQSKTSFHPTVSSSLPTTETETQLFPLTQTLLHMPLFASYIFPCIFPHSAIPTFPPCSSCDFHTQMIFFSRQSFCFLTRNKE